MNVQFGSVGIRGVRQHLGWSEHWEIAPPPPTMFGFNLAWELGLGVRLAA